jgi:hypothetical protein
MCELERKNIEPVTLSGPDDVKQGELKEVKDYTHPEEKAKKKKRGFLRKLFKRDNLVKIVRFLPRLLVYSPKNLIIKESVKGMLKIISKWIKDRGKEPSTYQGITAILSVVGVTLSPELWESILLVASGIIGIIQIVKKEKADNAS